MNISFAVFYSACALAATGQVHMHRLHVAFRRQMFVALQFDKTFKQVDPKDEL